MKEIRRRKKREAPVESVVERLNSLPKAPQHLKQEVHELPKWAKLALAKQAVEGIGREEAAREFGRSKQSLDNLASSPAGKKWREGLERAMDDPVKVAEMLIRANAVGITFDAFWALEAAKQAMDYKEVGIITRDMQDRIPELRKQTQAVANIGASQIVINLGVGASLEPPIVDASYEVLEAESKTSDPEIE